ncbi:MAG TPA: SpoIIE family protein phosphatase, partial [Leptospiraceae bacterium]|nr:SpoIIE family protein phosphatase [Leptospiraceae bacterium]
RSATDEVIQLEGEGTFLGMFEDASQHIKDYRFKLYPGDKLFVYTDGFLEGISDEGDPFQLEDLADLIKKYGQLDTKQCLQKVIQEYHNFCMGTDQSDDITLIAMGLSPKLKEFEDYKSLGEKLYAEGKVGKACESLIKAKEIFPTDMSVLYLLGKYSAKLKDYKSAIEHLEEYNSFKTFNADSHMILGYSYFNMEDYNKAEREFLKSISLRAGNVTSYLYLAKLFFKKKEYDKSRETLNKLLEIEPDHQKALVMMKHLRKLQKS